MNPALLPSAFAAIIAIAFASCAEAPSGPRAALGAHEGAISEGTLAAATRGGGGAGSAVEVAGDPEGIVRRGGHHYYLKDLKLTRLSPGDRVGTEIFIERDGRILLGDGRRVRLVDGEMLTRDGQIREAPPVAR